MIYYTADLHLGHKNSIKYDSRPFQDIDEMDNTLTEIWNARVRNDDDVYIVGDFCFSAKKSPEYYLKQLRGKKHLIVGNHDQVLLKDESVRKQFETIDRMTKISDGDQKIILCHYPLAEWEGYYKGYWHIFGHIHNNMDGNSGKYIVREGKALNAGCMINGYMPVTFNELLANNNAFRTAILTGTKNSSCRQN